MKNSSSWGWYSFWGDFKKNPLNERLWKGSEEVKEKSTALTVWEIWGNTLKWVAQPVLTILDRYLKRVHNILGQWAVSIRHPLDTMKKNGWFFKTTWKGLWQVITQPIWATIDSVTNVLTPLWQIYEHMVNRNVVELAELLHMQADKMRKADIFALSTAMSWVTNLVANASKVISKSVWYVWLVSLFRDIWGKLDMYRSKVDEWLALNNFNLAVPWDIPVWEITTPIRV